MNGARDKLNDAPQFYFHIYMNVVVDGGVGAGGGVDLSVCAYSILYCIQRQIVASYMYMLGALYTTIGYL